MCSSSKCPDIDMRSRPSGPQRTHKQHNRPRAYAGRNCTRQTQCPKKGWCPNSSWPSGVHGKMETACRLPPATRLACEATDIKVQLSAAAWPRACHQHTLNSKYRQSSVATLPHHARHAHAGTPRSANQQQGTVATPAKHTEKLLAHKTATTAGLQDAASQLLSLPLPTARDTKTHTEGAQQYIYSSTSLSTPPIPHVLPAPTPPCPPSPSLSITLCLLGVLQGSQQASHRYTAAQLLTTPSSGNSLGMHSRIPASTTNMCKASSP